MNAFLWYGLCLVALEVGLLHRVLIQAVSDAMFDAQLDATGVWRLPVGDSEMLNLPRC